MRRLVLRSLALTLVTTMALLGAGCRKSPRVGMEGRVEPSGNVLLTSRNGDPVSLRQQRTLRPGDVVEVSDGTAKIVLPSGATLELRPQAVVAFDRGPELRNGDLLVMAQREEQPVRSAGSVVKIGAGSVTRLTQTLSLRVGTYTGDGTVVVSGGQPIGVPPLRQVAVPAVGVVPGAPSPLVLGRDDPWDKRFLPDVLANLDMLDALSRGFSSQAATEGRTVGFYRTTVPPLDPESAFQQSYVDQLREPGEVLVGSIIALLGRKGTFATRLSGSAAFRAEGAPWALVAKDQDVPSFEVLQQTIEEAINRSAQQLAAVVPAVPPPPAVPTPTTRRPRTTPRSTPPPTAPTPSPNTPTTTPPPDSPPPIVEPPPESPGILQPIVDPVVALLEGLLGAGR